MSKHPGGGGLGLSLDKSAGLLNHGTGIRCAALAVLDARDGLWTNDSNTTH